MIRTLKRLFNSEGKSKNLAKSRLSFVLVQDRTGLTQDEIASFKKEMVAVIEKYFVIDEKGLDVSYKRETDSTMLVINSPVVVKRQEGLKHVVGAKHKGSSNAPRFNTEVKTIGGDGPEGTAKTEEATKQAI